MLEELADLRSLLAKTMISDTKTKNQAICTWQAGRDAAAPAAEIGSTNAPALDVTDATIVSAMAKPNIVQAVLYLVCYGLKKNCTV